MVWNGWRFRTASTSFPALVNSSTSFRALPPSVYESRKINLPFSRLISEACVPMSIRPAILNEPRIFQKSSAIRSILILILQSSYVLPGIYKEDLHQVASHPQGSGIIHLANMPNPIQLGGALYVSANVLEETNSYCVLRTSLTWLYMRMASPCGPRPVG